MHIDWTIGAGDSLRETLDYWVEHNGSIAYSNKILDEVLNVEKEIARQPLFLAKFLDEIHLYRRTFFSGKFAIYFEILDEENRILIHHFRSSKQQPL
ncbi:MAG: hypothetical protein ACFN40_01810 [Bacteroidota bacterium]